MKGKKQKCAAEALTHAKKKEKGRNYPSPSLMAEAINGPSQMIFFYLLKHTASVHTLVYTWFTSKRKQLILVSNIVIEIPVYIGQFFGSHF